MPTHRPNVPKYRHYKPKDLAVVRLNGKDHYLGKYDSPESHELYDRLVAEWLSRGRQPPIAPQNGSAATTVNKLLLAFLQHAETYYVKNGRPTSELAAYKGIARLMRRFYGTLPVSEFGPKALKAVRAHLIESGVPRVPLNLRIGRIKRIFAWGVEEEIVAPAVFHALEKVRGLRRGKTAAPESKRIRPVAAEHVNAVTPYLSPQVAAMVQVQLLTGMRPGEVVSMRACDIDRTRPIWVYEPVEHKTQGYDKERPICIGPQAQMILEPFLNRPPEAFLFSPKEAEEWRQKRRAEQRNPNRKTKIYLAN